MKTRQWIITHWEEICVVLIISALFLMVLSTVGCCSAKCIKTVEVPVEVKVPIPVEAPALPVPEKLQCEAPAGETWRDSALFIKECFDSALQKIEEYNHILTSYNETRSRNP